MAQNPKSARSDRTGKKGGPQARAVSAHNPFRNPVQIFGKPVARDIIFSNHRGVYKKGVEKRQRSLLVKIPFINSFLEDGEVIALVTTAYAPLTKLERFLLRYLTVFQRRALLVFTNRRMFYIPTTFNYGYRYSIAEIRYTNSKSIQVVGRSLVFNFYDGGFQHFPYIGRKERRKLQSFLGGLSLEGGPTGSLTLTYLCASCGAVVPLNSASCPQCRLRFRTPAKAGKMALLIPGGGYFYMRNTLYGVGDAVMELLLIVLLSLSVADMYHGFKGSILAAILIGTALAGIKAVSFFHSQLLVQGCFPVTGRLPSIRS